MFLMERNHTQWKQSDLEWNSNQKLMKQNWQHVSPRPALNVYFKLPTRSTRLWPRKPLWKELGVGNVPQQPVQFQEQQHLHNTDEPPDIQKTEVLIPLPTAILAKKTKAPLSLSKGYKRKLYSSLWLSFPSCDIAGITSYRRSLWWGSASIISPNCGINNRPPVFGYQDTSNDWLLLLSLRKLHFL